MSLIDQDKAKLQRLRDEGRDHGLQEALLIACYLKCVDGPPEYRAGWQAACLALRSAIRDLLK